MEGKRMVNIRLRESDIRRLMEIATKLQQERGDYRIGAATVIEMIVQEYLSREIPEHPKSNNRR